MEELSAMASLGLLPWLLLLARMSGFFVGAPLFSWQAVPVVVRAGLVLLLTVFQASVALPVAPPGGWGMAMVLCMLQEITFGLALGLTAHLVFLSVQQGARILGMQMGMADAGIIDPAMGEESESISLFFEMTFVLLFLTAGAHHVLLRVLIQSYQALPVGAALSPAAMAEAIIKAGSAMLLFGLQLAAPILLGFLLLAVVLAVLARSLPEMNVLVESFPLRMGMGLFLAAAVFPMLSSFTTELARWMSRYLLT